MKNIFKVDERLKTVAGFVRQGSRLLDIGTDHAHLPVYLIKSGVCPSAVATDVVPGPLKAAEKTVIEKGMENEISLFLSDGFDSVPENCADDIVIAGMGGELIERILSRCKWIKRDGIRLVLQPMTHPEVVRRYLYENRVYCVIAAEFTGVNTDFNDAQCYIGKLPKCAISKEAAACFLKKQHERMCKRRDALAKNNQHEEEYSQLLDITEKMEKYL